VGTTHSYQLALEFRMNSFFNNPIVHGIAAALAMALGWFVTSGNPILTVTIGAILKGIYIYLVQVTA
jgi:uncharacterized membrane protein (DUF106 family)